MKSKLDTYLGLIRSLEAKLGERNKEIARLKKPPIVTDDGGRTYTVVSHDAEHSVVATKFRCAGDCCRLADSGHPIRMTVTR